MKNLNRLLHFHLLGMVILCALPTLLWAQPLETETARFLKAGGLKIENIFEYQTSAEGIEKAVPLAFEYGITDKLELLVEPVVTTSIRPKRGRGATGTGDLEATLGYHFLPESSSRPALAIAAELKIPTTKNSLIGTGKTDYTVMLIASKRAGRFDTHANLGYGILGKPAGIQLNNIFIFAAAEEFHVNKKFDLVGEILGNTSSLGGSENQAESAVTPEAAGGELIGMLGTRCYLRPSLFLSFGVTYDNNNAVLLRPGLTFKF